MAQIIRAQHMGFCFGVRDALAAAEATESPEQTAIYGELVHNQQVVTHLQQRQFQLVSETSRDEVPERPQVMITAHGISDARRTSLLDSGKQLIDTTCPLVRRVHDAATGLASRGYFVVLIGKENHVEVQGIVEDLPPGQWAVVSHPSDVARYASKEIGVICQTTMPEELAVQCRDRVAERNPTASIRWINTICRPTRQRQAAVDELCEQVDVVVVVGGSNSNNTKRLVQRCESNAKPAFHVQSASDLRSEWFAARTKIGLTAGTSTPDATIDEVEKRIQELSTKPSHCSSTSKRTWNNKRWIQYFEDNLATAPSIPWSDSVTLTRSERQSIAKSVQTFQLGESGEGKHILGCAANWVADGGEAEYETALKLFLQEENRHADLLGRFLKQEGVSLLKRQWSDGCFRRLRHLAGLRTSISVLLTAEILAQVYYLALQRATNSPTLKSICRRVLRDECAHVRFQQQQCNKLSQDWGRFRMAVVSVGESLLFKIAQRIVWHDHRSVFRSAGMNWKEYRMRSDRRWRCAKK